jgi:hypothetical protein
MNKERERGKTSLSRGEIRPTPSSIPAVPIGLQTTGDDTSIIKE